MVLVTFRFIGLAHLHSPWGCLVFVASPRGLAWFVWVFAPLGFLFAVLVGFSLGCLRLWCGLGVLASRRHGVVVSSRWAFALGVHGVLSLWAAAAAAVAAPSLCAVGQFRSKFTHVTAEAQVFCQSAIDSAQSDHSTKCQAILADKDRNQDLVSTCVILCQWHVVEEMHIEKIKDLFQEIDEERTGIITYQTFQRKMNSPEVRS
eukprot:s1276_g5.t1